jgi:hypothetical protein
MNVRPSRKLSSLTFAQISFVAATFSFVNPTLAEGNTVNAQLLSQSSNGSSSTSAAISAVNSQTANFSPTVSALINQSPGQYGAYGSAAVSSTVANTSYALGSHAIGIYGDGFARIANNYSFQILTSGTYAIDSFITAGFIQQNPGFGQAWIRTGTPGITANSYFKWVLEADSDDSFSRFTSGAGMQSFWFNGKTTFDPRSSGIRLSNYREDDGFTSWGDTHIISNLGFLAAGSTLNLQLTAETRAQTYSIAGMNGSNPNFECGALQANNSNPLRPYSFCGTNTVSFGDPLSLNGGGNQVFSGGIPNLILVSAVPEPAEWLMLIAGIAVVVRAGKRQRSVITA